MRSFLNTFLIKPTALAISYQNLLKMHRVKAIVILSFSFIVFTKHCVHDDPDAARHYHSFSRGFSSGTSGSQPNHLPTESKIFADREAMQAVNLYFTSKWKQSGQTTMPYFRCHL